MSEIKNIPASVSERLKNIAKKSGKAFDTLLLLYFQERFLYRLSISEYRDKFILKGGCFCSHKLNSRHVQPKTLIFSPDRLLMNWIY
ncbi:Abortive infection protein AbiEii [Paenibacillus amylolyticus]|uniref:Abortive infection protein AbiEii n=1 Tax=Paenibacillus amylolyticus TaxID=1451 RepID=UPI003D268878